MCSAFGGGGHDFHDGDLGWSWNLGGRSPSCSGRWIGTDLLSGRKSYRLSSVATENQSLFGPSTHTYCLHKSRWNRISRTHKAVGWHKYFVTAWKNKQWLGAFSGCETIRIRNRHRGCDVVDRNRSFRHSRRADVKCRPLSCQTSLSFLVDW